MYVSFLCNVLLHVFVLSPALLPALLTGSASQPLQPAGGTAEDHGTGRRWKLFLIRKLLEQGAYYYRTANVTFLFTSLLSIKSTAFLNYSVFNIISIVTC